jgi:hypothetical protein
MGTLRAHAHSFTKANIVLILVVPAPINLHAAMPSGLFCLLIPFLMNAWLGRKGCHSLV